jgi:hypothetical protein
VVLDIGGDVGAAIVFAPSWLSGVEIEIRRLSAPWEGHHVAVLERRLPDGPVHAAVFSALAAGSYQTRLRHRTGSAVLTFGVTAGQVTTSPWPEASSDVDRADAHRAKVGHP